MQRSLIAIVAVLMLYVASSGPARSILICDKLLSVQQDANGSLIYTTRRIDAWALVYAPLNLYRGGPAGAALENYWELFPIQSDLPADLR